MEVYTTQIPISLYTQTIFDEFEKEMFEENPGQYFVMRQSPADHSLMLPVIFKNQEMYKEYISIFREKSIHFICGVIPDKIENCLFEKRKIKEDITLDDIALSLRH